MALQNIRLDIQYDGTDYSGWQIQPNAVTVQQKIEEAIVQVTGQKVALKAAGRTDAGVHALGQVANFEINHNLPAEKYRDAINHFVPDTILVKSSKLVASDFNARYSAVRREYRYRLSFEKSALLYKYRWEYGYRLDMDKMNKITESILGTHDFSAFCVVSSLKENNDCNISYARWREFGDEIIFDIKANRFLHSMVRSLVGAMVDSGRPNDYLTLEEFKDILKSCDHQRLKNVAPARGLYLVAVGY